VCGPSLGKRTKSPSCKKEGKIGVSAVAIGAIPQKSDGRDIRQATSRPCYGQEFSSFLPHHPWLWSQSHVLGVVIRPDPAQADAATSSSGRASVHAQSGVQSARRNGGRGHRDGCGRSGGHGNGRSGGHGNGRRIQRK